MKTLKTLFGFILFVAVCAMGMIVPVDAADSSYWVEEEYSSFTPIETNDVSALVNAVNEQRAMAGQLPLRQTSELTSAAAIRAKEASQLWSPYHTRPNGKAFNSVNPKVVFAENLAYVEACGYSPEYVTSMWVNSRSHAANIFDPEFRTMGIAWYMDSETGILYIAQEFGY